MTQEQKRIKIAEACGWRKRIYGGWGQPNDPPDCKGRKDKVWDTTKDLPDYFNDLNAMHEAEKVLTIEETFTYLLRLEDVCNGSFLGLHSRSHMESAVLIHSSAAQRAEAFGLTLNLWT